ncbi:hypothetical protein HPP92_018472 [Vanilla planifolia]|uniref:Dirigent protein n=1 Tax=Vanilla planifolia TaxID=51239 RepID=A0A835UMV9_VANPL|nr:hypothetical protein HPP92_019092 [Vanilla planifolia]KAG0469144.1 hypothetical protein HPP92_018472 [Vanilla planifolia]
MKNVNTAQSLYISSLLSIFVIINSLSLTTARTPGHQLRLLFSNSDPKLSFLVVDILKRNQNPSESVSGKVGHLNDLFSYEVRIPTNTGSISVSSSSGTANSANTWWALLTSMQALESGTVTILEEVFAGNVGHQREEVMGKLQGIYVTSSKDNSSHMVAMRATFERDGELADSLRFFGVHKQGLIESQIAVVGGSGRYDRANGFALVKAVVGEGKGMEKKLLFSVYLK